MRKYKKNLHIDGDKVISYTTHVATIDSANRELIVHGYWSPTTSKHINFVASEYGLKKVEHRKIPEPGTDPMRDLKTVAFVATLGNIFGKTLKEKNDWKARMLGVGLENKGLIMPDDWDTLSEAEKERRLDGAINQLN